MKQLKNEVHPLLKQEYNDEEAGRGRGGDEWEEGRAGRGSFSDWTLEKATVDPLYVLATMDPVHKIGRLGSYTTSKSKRKLKLTIKKVVTT